MVTFSQVGTSRLFVPEEFAGDPASARLGLVVDEPVPRAVTLPTVWSRSALIFWPPGIGWSHFLAGLPAQLSGLPTNRQRLVFFDRAGIRSQYLMLPPDDTLAATFPLALVGTSYTLNLASGAGFVVGSGGLRLAPAGQAHYLVFEPEDTPFYVRIDGALHLELLGPARGCWQFLLDLTDEKLAGLETEFRYFRVQPPETTDDDEVLRRIEKSGFPLFHLPKGQSRKVNACFDPLDPFSLDRNALTFSVGDRLGTYFESLFGHPVEVLATTSSRLVFDRTPQVIRDNDHGILRQRTYLTPAGAFELAVAGDSGQPGWPEEHGLLLGTSVSEYATFRPRRGGAAGDFLVFEPRQPATDRASIGNVAPAGSGARSLLSDFATTSWVALRRGMEGEPALVCQPAELELFADLAQASTQAGPRGLRFDPRARQDGAAAPLPLVPFLGVAQVTNDPKTHLALESRLIALARQEELRLTGRPALASAATEMRATPHGFPVAIAGDVWQRLTLARTPRGGDLILSDMGPPLQRALSGNRTLLVATRLGAGLGRLADQLDVAGWGFRVDISQPDTPDSCPPPEQPTHLPPTFLLKYHDSSLCDLLGLEPLKGRPIPDHEPIPFTEAEAFNCDWKLTWRLLRKYVTETFERHEKLGAVSPYANFLGRFSDPGWNGLLFLNAGVSTAVLPTQVKGLLPGIRLEHFRAHHLGLDLNRLGQEGFQIDRSALFGVVEYPLAANEPAAPFDPSDAGAKVEDVAGEGRLANFRVDSLRIQFENNEVRRFDCRVSLWLEKLFREATTGDKIISFDGRYERRREPNGQQVETYTFSHEGLYEFPIDSFILEKLTVRRLQMTTLDADDQQIVTRFALRGSLEFKQIDDLDLFSLDQIDFDDLGIDLNFDISSGLKRFVPHFGALRFDLADLGRRSDGLLGKLPFRLKFFQVGKGLSLPDLGYLSFGNRFGDGRFDFGLGFDLDLGSLGSLAKKLGGLRLEALLGWLPKQDSPGQAKFAFGFKFQGNGGGALDLGIEGVLKLVIEHLKIEPFKYGEQTQLSIQAVNARLEVLGRKFPEDSKLKLFLFLDPSKVASGRAKVAWLGVLEDGNGGEGFQLPVLALGQRVNAYPKSGVPTTKEVVDHIKVEIGAIDDTDKLVSVLKGNDLRYDPKRDWTVALRAQLWEVADVDLVFLDPDLYGIRIRVPGAGKEPQLFALDVLYRKISDDLGVYSIELAVPDAWRQIDFAYFSLTLPIIGLELYTNGDFQIDLGYPWDLDFSRSCQVQILPFLGSGGFYYAQLSSASSRVVPTPKHPGFTYDPVVQVGFAARVGVGREFQKGILRAGLSVSVFCTLEGAWGQRRWLSEKKCTHPVPPKHYLRVAGSVGVLGEIYGHIDFSIVKASVSIRIWVAFGWVLETYHPLILSIEAGVSVRVSVVIGRFRIFGKTFEIKILLSFSTRVRFEWALGKGDLDLWNRTFERSGARLFASPATTKALADELGPVVVLDGSSPPTLPSRLDLQLRFGADLTVSDSQPVTVALLAIDLDSLGKLGRALAHWAVAAWLARSTASSGDLATYKFSLQAMRHLEACLEKSRSSFASAADLRQCFSQNLHFRIGSPVDGSQAEGAIFPFLAELGLRYRLDGQEIASVDLADIKVSATYLQDLDAGFERLRVLLAERQRLARQASAPPPRPLADFLFEDYCRLVLRQMVDSFEGHLAELTQNGPAAELTLAELLAALESTTWAKIGAAASRFFLHGLRVPNPGDGTKDLPLFELAGLAQRLPDPLPPAATYAIELVATPGCSWLELDAGCDLEVLLDQVAALPLKVAASLAQQPELRSPLRPRVRRYPLETEVDWLAPHGHESLWALPASLRHRLREDLELRIWRSTAESGAASRERSSWKIEAERETDSLPSRWATAITFQVESLGDAAGGRAVYRLLPLGEAERRLLDRMDDDPSWATGVDAHLLFRSGADGGADSHRGVAAELWRVDLSTEPEPEALARALSPPDLLVRASLSEPAALIGLLRRASLVRSNGYFLGYRGQHGQGLPDHLFDAKGRGELVLLLIHGAQPQPFANRVLLPRDPTAETDRKVTYARALHPERDFELDLAFAPGTVGFRAYRLHPDHLGDEGARPLAEAYHLLEYNISSSGKRLTKPSEVLPVGPREIGAAAPGDEPRERPSGLAEDDWCYEHILPAHKLLDDGSGSPYAGVGRKLEVDLRFRDAYGHHLATNAGSIELPVRYIDRLYSPVDWPSVVASFDVVERETLKIELRFDAWAFFDEKNNTWPAQPSPGEQTVAGERTVVEEARDRFLAIRQQLEDPRTALSLEASLAVGGGVFDIEDQRAGLVQFVKNIDAFLAGLPRTGPRPGTPPRPAHGPTWSMTRLIEPRVDDTLQLEVALRLRRPLDLLDPALFAGRQVEAGKLLVPEAWTVAATLPAAVAVDDQSAGFVKFAERFEAAFGGLKLAVGLGADGARALWVVRASLVGIERARANASYFALPPLATRPLAGEIRVPELGEDLPAALLRVADVDLDHQLRELCRDVEVFLMPALADRVRQIDTGKAFDRVVRAKAALATSLADRLVPIFEDPALTPDPVDSAIDRLRERLLSDLRDAHEVDTLVVLPIKTGAGSTAPNPPVGFGALIDPTEGSEVRRLSTGNLPLSAGTTYLTFSLDSKREGQRASEILECVYRLTHIERRIDGRPVDRDTAWLQLVRPIEMTLPRLEVPVPLRQLPTPPVVEDQRAEPADVAPGTFEDELRSARRWHYVADFALQQMPQDSLFLEVLYNFSAATGPTPAARIDSDPSQVLLRALGAYHYQRATLWATLDAIASDRSPAWAADHLAALADRIEAVAAAFLTGARSLVGPAVERELFRIQDHQADEQGRRLEVSRLLDVFGGQFGVSPRDKNGREIEVIWEPQPDPALKKGRYAAPQTELFRPRFRRFDLDILQAESAWAGVLVRRNHRLVNDLEINPAFHYETPAIRFGEPLTPRIERLKGFVVDGPRTLVAQIERLLEAVPGATDAAIELRWGYESGRLAQALGGDAHELRPPHPIAFIPAFRPSAFREGAAAASITALLQEWLDVSQPTQGFLVAEVRVYGRIEKPVLRLRRVVLPLTSLS